MKICKCDRKSKYARCTDCNKKYMLVYYTKNKEILLEKQHQYNKDNQSDIRERRKVHRENNKEKIAKQKHDDHLKHKLHNNLRSAKWYSENRERTIENSNRWVKEHKEEVREYKTQYDKLKAAESIEYRIKRALRSRLRAALKHNLKKGSAVRDLGCSVANFKQYIEDKFYPNPITGELMSWSNYGNGKLGWQIDHIKALSLFDLIDKKQVLEAVNYTNLQPLWFTDHIKKTRLDRRSKYANLVP